MVAGKTTPLNHYMADAAAFKDLDGVGVGKTGGYYEIGGREKGGL